MHRPTTTATRRTTALIAGGSALALALSGAAIAAPASAASGLVDDAVFTWGLNHEVGGGAFAGGCNFLSAGVAGSTEGSRVWTEADGFWSASEGDVSILKPNAEGDLVAPTFATKCQDANGTTVGLGTDSYSGNVVRITDGAGVADPDTDSAVIEWEGSFTVAFYGGMTYWSATDPVLDVENGVGTVTATLSGYGTDMNDLSQWIELDPQEIVIAELDGVDVTDEGFEITPEYLGVELPADVEAETSSPQSEYSETNAAYWGSFPAEFVEFQILTGQDAYWFTTGTGSWQPRKATTPLAVDMEYTEGPATITTSKVTIDGKVKGGKTVRVELAKPWSPKPEYSYKWTVDGKQVGSNSKSLKLKGSWAGDKVKVQVTGTLDGYDTAVKTSDAKKIAKK